MKALCRTCHKQWILSKEHEGNLDDYECPPCEKKRIQEQRKRPYGTTNSDKARRKIN